MIRWFFFIITMLVACASKGQGFLTARGERIINEKGKNVLLRGYGLGGWMLQEGYMLGVYQQGQQHLIRSRIEELTDKEKTTEFYNAWLRNHTTKADIDSLKAWGFNSVRLPMHYNLYTFSIEDEPIKGKNTWLEKGFALTDSLLKWCKANEIYLILDLHAAPGGQGNDLNISDRDPSKPSLWDSETNKEKTIALWRKLASRYAGEPWIGGYDILNEPNWGFEDPVNDKNGLKESKNIPLRKLLIDITKAIREVDNNHIIIREGNGWGNNYNGIMPAWDDNMVLSFHKYWNYNNLQSISHILQMRTQYKLPVWIGETGENSNVWFTQAVSLFENNNIGWAWWPLKKIGNNNPLQVLSNPEYEKILNYWRSGTNKPTADEAYRGVMQLAEGLRIENNIVKRDVIDALIRQPHSEKAIPFKPHEISKGNIIKAIDYDLGRNGIAYFDTDTADYHISDGSRGGNKGGQYRNDGVDIHRDSVSGDFVVYNIADGEWLQFTVNAEKAEEYPIQLTVRGKETTGKIKFFLNGSEQESIEIPPAKLWKDVKMTPVSFQKGKNVIKIWMEKGGFEFKEFRIGTT